MSTDKYTTPTTELDAVNTLLEIIGETPMTTFTDQMVADAVTARNILAEVSRAVQLEGWHFNTEEEYPLVPDGNGEILPPSNCVKVKVDRQTALDFDVVQRGKRLYNKKTHSFQFADTLYATLTILLPFEDMPEAARWYITVRAGRVFQARVIGSGDLYDFTQRDELDARGVLVDAETDVADNNIMGNSYLGNWAVGNVLQR